MAVLLRQSTERIVRVGMFRDRLDGVTPETGVTLSGADEAEVLKAGGGASTDISSNTWGAVSGADGWYDLTLTTSDTNTVGELIVVVQDDSVCLPVHQEFMVIEEAIYDALFAASAAGFDASQRVDVGSWLGNAVTASSGNPDVNIESIDASAITASSIATDAITAAKVAADAIGASELATDAVNEIADGVLTRQMTESYNSDGTAPTLAQALCLLISALTEFAISGTTITCKKLDGATTAATFTIDDSSNPTSRTRAT